MKRTNFKLSMIFALALLILNSCIKQDSGVPPGTSTGNSDVDALIAMNASPGFNYEMQKEVNLDITLLAPDNTPLEFIPVSILDRSAELGGMVLFTSLTGENGKISGKIRLGTDIAQVVIDPLFAGLMRNVAVNIVSGNIVCRLGGSDGYSGNVVLNSPLTGSRYAFTGSLPGKPLSPASPYSFMGSFDKSGKPAYLEPVNEIINASFLKNINASLPESKPLMTYHPDYLSSNAETNANITALSDVWFTFISEGASYLNSIAYFTYPTNHPPQKPAEIDSLHIILPNASLSGSGGSLLSGNSVKLGRFPAGTSIGFAMIANGWNGTTVGNGLWTIYSLDQLNPEADINLKRHSVLLYDNLQQLFLIGMEDVKRDLPSCDHDFNDCLFYIKSNPVTAIAATKVNPIDVPVDTDKDGVNDVYDRFPNDPTRAYINYYPSAATMGTIAFEDYWPFLGDYDMNDLVVSYQYGIISNALNKSVEMNARYVLQGSGATYKNGFGVQFPFLSSLVKSATGCLISNGKLITMGSNGCESGQAQAVIIPFDDAYAAMKATAAFNTVNGVRSLTLDTISVNMVFTRPLLTSELGTAPFNPFIIINGTRGREAHLPGYLPTDKVDKKFFKQGVDNTDPSKGIYYKTTSNLPWALNFNEGFSYPAEKNAINSVFLKFESWVKSNGTSNTNWYKDTANIVKSKVYKK